MRYARGLIGALAMLVPLAALAMPAKAEDTLKLAIGQQGNWETAVADIGSRAGIFKKHGLTLDSTYTKGAGETIQAVISGAVDIGIGVGTTIAYSTAGSSTNLLVLGFLKTYNLKAKPTKTGSPPATLTEVMSGQVDVGWAAPPFGLKEIEEGKIRIVARGSEVVSTRNQTVRTLVVNADKLKKDRAIIDRFMTAYVETLDYMYSNPEALKHYKDFTTIDEARAKKAIAEFYPKEALDPYRIDGLDAVMDDAIEHKFLETKLSKEQLAELFQVPARKK